MDTFTAAGTRGTIAEKLEQRQKSKVEMQASPSIVSHWVMLL